MIPKNLSLDGPRNLVRELWDKLAVVPGGKRAFSAVVGRMAPYTGSIGASVVELSPGWAKVVLRDRRAVRNHLQCVHAIALANLAELCGNVAMAYTLPDDARFIVAGLSIEYVKKARGLITATSECPIVDSSAREEFEVPVTMKDAAGEVVATATLRTLVGPKRAKR
ncbi:MAG: DUF4442 domain-containing protein [Deltaproteobacteria bacterium]|nr:DUF4442 domain-containing protein [Deltaproteobacteria bacterium]